jgi:hypothetical protein
VRTVDGPAVVVVPTTAALLGPMGGDRRRDHAVSKRLSALTTSTTASAMNRPNLITRRHRGGLTLAPQYGQRESVSDREWRQVRQCMGVGREG